MATALIIVDVQNDFCEGGSLAVEGGARVASDITEWLSSASDRYGVVIATRDWHVDPGDHFSTRPDYADSWPVHCVAGSEGASFHPDLALASVDCVVSKGEHEAAYSGFEGWAEDGRSMEAVLRDASVDTVEVAGLATDYCVRATALDAKRLGFGVRVLSSLCAGVAPDTTRRSLDELQAAGVDVA